MPGSTDVTEYVKKVDFLRKVWPPEHLGLLAPRLALLCEGTSFKKVAQIDGEKLRSSNASGIELLIKALGGSFGLSQAERRFDVYEKALYSVTQKSDETHESYVARHDVQFEELKATGAGFEDIRSFILLRNSGLAAEDRKRIVMECEGNLTYEKVCRSIRILGSKVFNDLQGSKTNRTKTYDVHFTENDHHEDEPHSEKAFAASSSGPTITWEESELDTDFVEAMAANEDADALTIQNFEEELEGFMQETPDLMDAIVNNYEARQRLLQKKKSRRFWPVSKGTGKSQGRLGKGRSKGKGRQQLLDRIARSSCRACGEQANTCSG